MTVKMPKNRIKNDLSCINVGDVVWVVGWAIKVDWDRVVYLDLEASYQKSKEGTSDVKVTRTATSAWAIDISESSYQWSQELVPEIKRFIKVWFLKKGIDDVE